jgi:hypothetical protein
MKELNFANHIGWTDINPYEIIKKNTDRKLTIRAMECERKNMEKLTFHIGGFSAHCSNQSEQEWDIKSNPESYVKEIRMNKKGEWKDKYGAKFVLGERPVKFYDYNF